MLTVHILTKNNSKTIQKTLDSIQWADKILIADLGSQDDTVSKCENTGAEILRASGSRHEIRNMLIKQTAGPTLYIEPWEVLMRGKEALENIENTSFVSIINNKLLTKEIRIWKDHVSFINPVYERIDGDGDHSDILLYSSGRTDYQYLLEEIQTWKAQSPLAIAPHYYEASTLLALGHWQQFLVASEHYMFLDKTSSISSVMNHYYFAMVQLIHCKKVKPTLQNLSLCLSANPLMAEFWCLAGDVHYHLTKKFEIAKGLYENAIILGSNRLKNDTWPMDISKYKSYPNKMIDSCNQLLESKSIYVPNRL